MKSTEISTWKKLAEKLRIWTGRELALLELCRVSWVAKPLLDVEARGPPALVEGKQWGAG